MILRNTIASDRPQIEKILDICFGKDRLSRTSYKIRHGVKFIKEYSFTLLEIDTVIGSISCWPVALFDEQSSQIIPMIMVGPIAIAPPHQNKGYGKLLVEKTLSTTDVIEPRPLMMIGAPEYYNRFGFAAMKDTQWQLPGPVEKHRLLIRGNKTLPAYGKLGPNMPAPHIVTKL